MSVQYRSVMFANVDVDNARELAQTYHIKAVPTFQLFKQTKKIFELCGADAKKLEEKIREFMRRIMREHGPHKCVPRDNGKQKGKRAASWLSSVRPLGSVSIDCTVRSLVRPPAAKMVKQIESKYAFQEALNSAGEKLVVVDFSATWCGPCKMIKPFFHSLSEKYSNVVFLEVDVDDCQDVAAECEVKCMPTFQFFKKGQKVGEFSGANKEKLEATINELI
ncbi:hypothetical protein E5288_WYG006767 [Bos mutus]|uniref:Thioredoxin n=1 Tax=Bos mutus TaxID=72004 RepID=A0A6B0RKF5_9CETA|nr:hypothetical protein [Bos mutus]